MTEDPYNLNPSLDLAQYCASGWVDPFTPQERRIMTLERRIEELENKNLINFFKRLYDKVRSYFAPKHKCCSCVEEDY